MLRKQHTPVWWGSPFAVLLLHILVSGCMAFEAKPGQSWDDLSSLKVEAFQMGDDFEGDPLYSCELQYFYYVPCPTYSWFWAYSGWDRGDILAASFTLGEQGTGGLGACSPSDYCRSVAGIEVLDPAGYGSMYPGVFGMELDVYCCDENLYPSCHLWNSGFIWNSHSGWNYFEIDPPVDIHRCPEHQCPYPTIVVTMRVGGILPEWWTVGFDNVSYPAAMGCEMHDVGCMAAAYPRKPAGSSGMAVHSGYVGKYAFEYWPPKPVPDGRHALKPQGSTWYGYVELAWRLYAHCSFP